MTPRSTAYRWAGARNVPCLLISTVLAIATTPASAQPTNGTLVQSGTSSFGFVDCIDLKSIVRKPGTPTTYDTVLADSKCNVDNEPEILHNVVDCTEDMSGDSFPIKSQAVSSDGQSDPWTEKDTDSTSMAGQTAKFVCGK